MFTEQYKLWPKESDSKNKESKKGLHVGKIREKNMNAFRLEDDWVHNIHLLSMFKET